MIHMSCSLVHRVVFVRMAEARLPGPRCFSCVCVLTSQMCAFLYACVWAVHVQQVLESTAGCLLCTWRVTCLPETQRWMCGCCSAHDL